MSGYPGHTVPQPITIQFGDTDSAPLRPDCPLPEMHMFDRVCREHEIGVWRQQPSQVTLLIFELVNWDRR